MLVGKVKVGSDNGTMYWPVNMCFFLVDYCRSNGKSVSQAQALIRGGKGENQFSLTIQWEKKSRSDECSVKSNT